MTDRDADTAIRKRRPGHRADRNRPKPQDAYPADQRPTDPDAIERSELPERDKQYGSDDN